MDCVQGVVGETIVDFCAPRVRLVVEVDGQFHAQQASADASRESRLVRAGYRVLRLPADLVREDLEGAVARVVGAL